MRTLTYKGYIATFELDEEAMSFYGTVTNTTDIITFRGTSAKELVKEFHKSIEEYLLFCKEKGVAAEKPYNGRILVRTSPSVHRDLMIISAIENRGMNDLAVEALKGYLLGKKKLFQKKSDIDKETRC